MFTSSLWGLFLAGVDDLPEHSLRYVACLTHQAHGQLRELFSVDGEHEVGRMKPFDTFPYTISRCKRTFSLSQKCRTMLASVMPWREKVEWNSTKKKKRFHLISYQLRRYDIFPVCASKNGDIFPLFSHIFISLWRRECWRNGGQRRRTFNASTHLFLPGGLVEKLVRQQVAR